MLNNNKIYSLVFLTLSPPADDCILTWKKYVQGTRFLKMSKQFDSIYIPYHLHFLDESYAGLS